MFHKRDEEAAFEEETMSRLRNTRVAQGHEHFLKQTKASRYRAELIQSSHQPGVLSAATEIRRSRENSPREDDEFDPDFVPENDVYVGQNLQHNNYAFGTGCYFISKFCVHFMPK